ncbi:DUF805 domain-containing protein [Polaromonas sp. YR568]|uniref:DUF805 domain-containing protein n=1 Tax=Polaromonas sp. YR568 TaxID=1855301 RepID=UPI00398BF116
MSEAVNPYAAPKAVVADVYDNEAGVQPVKLFSAKGRVGRLRYLAYNLGAYLFLVVGGMVLGLIAGALGSATAAGVLGILVAVPYFIFLVLLTIQRSHDMGWTGWTAILALIPFVGLIWLLNPGTKGGNRFGAPPPPNTTMVKIGGLAFPVIMLIGIIAAVALPAYQDYVKRAKASQIVKP